LLILPLLLGAAAPAPVRPVVLELFTSQSCSSCPPADALLAALAATRDDVLPLDFHVDYWDYLQWRDRFSSRAATQRQRQYSVLLGSEVYTPQLVVDGQLQAVGSQRDAVLAAIASARAALRPGPALSLAAAGDGLVVDIGAGTGSGEVVLLGFDPQHVTQVAAGENAGRTLREVNVVRSITPLGHWTGAVLHTIAGRAEGDRHAVLLQAADGRILAAAVL
jgi:hypothetical protein